MQLVTSFLLAWLHLKVLGKVIDIRLKSPGWIKSLEEEMSVERICGSIPTSASSTLLAEDADMGDEDYDMEGEGMTSNLDPQSDKLWIFRRDD